MQNISRMYESVPIQSSPQSDIQMTDKLKMLNKYKLIIILVIVVEYGLISSASVATVSCKDENNENVDWFYLYKLPKYYSHHDSKMDSSGLRYIYMTSTTATDEGWKMSTHSINETESLPGRTMMSLTEKNDTTMILAYNDENPNGKTDFIGGHTKGVVAASKTSGIWMIHSVPKYPPLPEYNYPTTGHHYGQSFLCISLNASQMDILGQQLLYNEPNFYYTHMPDALKGKYKNIEKALAKEWIQNEPFYSSNYLTSVNGTIFKSYAKSRYFNGDLYEDWVTVNLNDSLLVETWRNGGGNLKSNCSKSDKVFNVAGIEVPTLKIEFKTTLDHSKWAVTLNDGSDWICVGDINRQITQFRRGGGIVCQENAKVAKNYRNLVKNYDRCDEDGSFKRFFKKLSKMFSNVFK